MHNTILAFKKGLSSKLEKRLHMCAVYFQISFQKLLIHLIWSERRSSILLNLEVHLQLYLSLCYVNSSNTLDYRIGTWFISTSIPLPCRKGIAEGTKHKGIHTITKVKYSPGHMAQTSDCTTLQQKRNLLEEGCSLMYVFITSFHLSSI